MLLIDVSFTELSPAITPFSRIFFRQPKQNSSKHRKSRKYKPKKKTVSLSIENCVSDCHNIHSPPKVKTPARSILVLPNFSSDTVQKLTPL